MSFTGEVEVTRNTEDFDEVVKDTMAVSGAIISVAAMAMVAVGAIAVETGKAVNKAIQAVKLNILGQSLAKSEEKIRNLENDMEIRIEQIRLECYKQYQTEINALQERLNVQPNLSDFYKKCAQAQEKMEKKLEESKKTVRDEFLNKISDEIKKGKEIMSESRSKIIDSIKEITNDIKRMEKEREVAEACLAEIIEMAKAFKSIYGDNESMKAHLAVISAECDRIKREIEAKRYQSAEALAYNLKNAIINKISQKMADEYERNQEYVDVKALYDSCRNLVEEMKCIYFTSSKTCSGGRFESQIYNFPEYYRGNYEKRKAELDSIGRVFDHNISSISIERLVDIKEALIKWQKAFMENTQSAYDCLECCFEREQMYEKIVEEYGSNGYMVIDCDDEHDLDYLSVTLENEKKESRITLTLEEIQDENGRVTTRINIEDYTNYSGNIEKGREKTRQTICDTIRNCSIGQGKKTRQKCTN